MTSHELKNLVTHLRIPFSLFLAPVYFFALSETPEIETDKAVAVFFILHLLLFPASNGYNSYFDKDEESIGLIKKPPPVTGSLLTVSLILDILAVMLAILFGLGWFFSTYLILYGFMSKAYSHPGVRLKKYPLISLMVVVIFQGFYTYLATGLAVSSVPATHATELNFWFPALLCSLNLLAVYPLTQIYQHQEDERHGDLTYSRWVGIENTFRHAIFFSLLSAAGFTWYYLSTGRPAHLFLFFSLMVPSLVFLLVWWKKTGRNQAEANFRNTMWMNLLASAGLNIFFILARYL